MEMIRKHFAVVLGVSSFGNKRLGNTNENVVQ